MIKKAFDDYLGLIDYDFSEYKYIIFGGVSGSGKSTYINNILKQNKTIVSRDLLVIDEIYDLLDFIKCLKYLFKNKKFLISSHINKKYYYIFYIFGKIKFIKLDNNKLKISNYLKFRKIVFSDIVIGKYIKEFGANYTDIDIILEKYEGNNFDEAFYLFKSNNSLKLTGNKKEIWLKEIEHKTNNQKL